MICRSSFELTPEMFNGIEVRRLCWPNHSSKILLSQLLFNLFASILGVIVLLKDDVSRIYTIMLQSIEQLILQNLKVMVSIHPTINLGSIANSLSSHTLPHHKGTSFKLEDTFYQPIIKAFTCLFPHPFVPI